MTKEKVLVVGLGEVGHTLFELLNERGCFAVYGFDIDEGKMREAGQNVETLPREVDVMHICIPCKDQKNFAHEIGNITKQFKSKLLIINSTVPPGTTMEVYRQCGNLVAHSPFRGVHKSNAHMKWELTRWTKYVGGATAEAAKATSRHFGKAGLKTRILRSCLETELAKLFETTYRAWMVVCFQEMHRISRHFGADFDGIVDFLEDTHLVRLDRPLMFPGVIGGHCIIPNARLLLDSYESPFLRLILKSNEQREKEFKDVGIQSEAEKVKRRAEALEKKLAERSKSLQSDM